MLHARGNGTTLRTVNCTLALNMVVLLAACSGGGGGARQPQPPTATATHTATAIIPPSATTIPTFTKSSTPLASPTPTDSPPPSFTLTPIATCTMAILATATVPPSSTPTLTPTLTPTPRFTATPTATPLVGPVVSAFGIADASGTFNPPVGTDARGRAIFQRSAGADFIIFVEARPGVSRLPVGTNVFSSRADNPMGRPDLQIESSSNLGNGSSAVCDNSFPTAGGVPAITPPDFSPTQSISDALNDFGCRFKVFSSTDFACTQDSAANFVFGNPSSTVQFCMLVSDALTFSSGETVLTTRIRDTAGNAGPPTEIVVRITP